jgi:hypothetical protein
MPYQYGMQGSTGLPPSAVQNAVGVSPDFPVVGNGLGGLPVRSGSGGGSLFWVYTAASGTDQFSLTAFDIATGSLGTQSVATFSGAGTVGGVQPVFSASGKYLVTSIISGANYYIGVFDVSGGPGRVSYVDRFLISGGATLSDIRISPLGKYISCTTTVSDAPRYHIYDCTTGFSAPTKIADYGVSSFTTFSPRGFTFSPSGNTGYSAGSDEGGSVLIPSLTRYAHDWVGYNQNFRGYSYNGDIILYFGNAVQINPQPFTRAYLAKSTSGASQFTIGPNIFPAAIYPIAGLPHIAGFSYLANAGVDSWTTSPEYGAGYLRIYDYSNNSIVLTSTYFSAGTALLPVYLLNGDLVHWNATAAARQVLRPSTNYSDVTALYSASTLAVVSRAVLNSTPNTNCWPAFGKQILYSTI